VEKQFVEAAVLILQARGEKVSTRTVRNILGRGSYRDLRQHLKASLGELPIEDEAPVPVDTVLADMATTCSPVPGEDEEMVPMENAMVPPSEESATEEAEIPCPEPSVGEAAPAPPTLLQQAEARLREAIAAEHAARRALQDPRGGGTPEALNICRRERMTAAVKVDTLAHSRDNLTRGIRELRRTLHYDEGELDRLVASAQQSIARARRQVEQTRTTLNSMMADLAAIAGTEAIPPVTVS
jgi:hypothetical protein